MSDKTPIEWTATVNADGSVTPGATWNPTRGCSRVSEGCRNCYAESIAARFSGPGKPFEGFAQVAAPRDDLDRVGKRRNGWTGKVELIEDKLLEPLSWRKPRKVFVNSMSDLFHEELSDEAIDRVFAVMAACHQHVFQILTKRADRMRSYCQKFSRKWKLITHERHTIVGLAALSNVWLGVSVENQHFADERIPLLLDTPAAVRFISAEPLLGPVDLQSTLWNRVPEPVARRFRKRFDESTDVMSSLFGLDWVIIGGESGPGARTFHVNWARDIVKQCAEACVACFVKQLGDSPQFDRDETLRFVRSRKGGDIEEFPADLRVRQWPTPCAQ